MIKPFANTQAMNIHLQEISTEVAPGAHAVLVCDSAGWSYSPELNPMENVWDYRRRNKLCPTVWKPATTSSMPVKALAFPYR